MVYLEIGSGVRLVVVSVSSLAWPQLTRISGALVRNGGNRTVGFPDAALDWARPAAITDCEAGGVSNAGSACYGRCGRGWLLLSFHVQPHGAHVPGEVARSLRHCSSQSACEASKGRPSRFPVVRAAPKHVHSQRRLAQVFVVSVHCLGPCGGCSV